MSSTAAAQLRRVLALIPRLADGEDHSVADVAAQAGTTTAALLRDLQAISERFDAPGGFVDGVSILIEQETVSVSASHFLRPMRLTMPELCALELGVAMLRRTRTPAEQEPLTRALERLRGAISAVPANDQHAGLRHADLGSAGSTEHLAALRAAVRDDRMVRLGYRAGGATETSTRVICPHSLIYAEQMWYVVAPGDDGALRFYRLDRVEAVSPLEEQFERDANIAVSIRESGRAFVSASAASMTVRYSPRIARWVAEREGASLEEDGSLVLEHPVADERWALRHVLQYGPDAELVAPAALRARLSERLRAMAEES